MQKVLTSHAFVLGLIILISIFHFFGLYYGWYEHVRHFDKFHHFLGGFWIPAFVAYLYRARAKPFGGSDSSFTHVLLAIGLGVTAGVLWEFFEFSLDQMFAPGGPPAVQGNLADTMGDLAMDFLGAAAYGVLYSRSSRGEER